MFFIFILLWLIAIILIYANPKATWARWASCCLFFNGFGGVAVIFKDDVIPFVEKFNDEDLKFFALTGKGIADVLQHYFATYALICFVLYFTDFLDYNPKNSTKKAIIFLLAIPSFLMYILYPINPYFEPDYKVLSSWVVIYTLLSIALLIVSIIKEKDSHKRYNKICTSFFSIPTALSIMWTSYLSVAVGYHEVWYLNIWIILFQFVVFVYLAVKHGILGVRLRVERFDLNNNIDTMINGISMISHAIKNEAGTISLCVDTIKALEKVSPSTDKKLSVIKESCKNLNEFTHRINKFRTMEMEIEPHYLSSLVEKAVEQVMPFINDRQITIVNEIRDDLILKLDAIHIAEVIRNLLINAIESIDRDGIIIINSEIRDERVSLSVTDNGVGIKKEDINKVLTPFYSTKKGRNNFGLGLSYCYRIMSSHKGDIRISSKENLGTTISLIFPLEQVVRPQIQFNK